MFLSTAALLCWVLAVQDGDSLQVRCEGDASSSAPMHVRIHAIDAPEHGQAHGRRARDALRTKIEGQPVQLRCVTTDAYGRRVCQVFKTLAPDSPPQDVGLAQVAAGLAWWYRRYAPEQAASDRERYEATELQARLQRVGLWADGERAVPPWRWRRSQMR